MNWEEIESVIYADCDTPYSVLGIKKVGKEKLIQTYHPASSKIVVNYKANGKKVKKEMERVDEDGFYAIFVSTIDDDKYTFDIHFEDGTVIPTADAYAVKPNINKALVKEFLKGYSANTSKLFGGRITTIDGVTGALFTILAPNALRVSVVGDFDLWDGRVCPMQRIDDGMFALFIPELKAGQNYMYEIKYRGEKVVRKADPYALSSKNGYSVIAEEYTPVKVDRTPVEGNLRLLEIKLSEFMDKNDQMLDGANKVVNYCKANNYNAIKLLPIQKHDSSDLDVYHYLSLYTLDSDFGEADLLIPCIETIRKAGIKVILEVNTAYFSKDNKGLNCFDGTELYEHKDVRQGYHSYFDAKLYQFANPYVTSYLYGGLTYLLDRFGFDGFSFVNVASQMYLDYNLKADEWLPNVNGGNENLEAIEFVKKVNKLLKKSYKNIILSAHIDAYWPHVTDKSKDSLGFDYVVNTGFTTDLLHYLQADPAFRSGSYEELTEASEYAYNENFLVSFSNTDNHRDFATILGRMPGNTEEKLANARLCLAYKAFFPGNQSDLYAFNRLLEDDISSSYKKKHDAFVTGLNKFVCDNALLNEFKVGADGFKWINKELYSENVYVFTRESLSKKGEVLYFVINASRDDKDKFSFGVPVGGKFKEVFNTDMATFGGEGFVNKQTVATDEFEAHGYEQSVSLKLAKLSVSVYSFKPYTAKELEQIRIKKRDALIKRIETEKVNIENDRKAAILAINEEADRKIKELDQLLVDFDNKK